MKFQFLLPVVLAFSVPTFAQDMSHGDHDMHAEDHDHHDHDHNDHNMSDMAEMNLPSDVEAALTEGGSLIRVEVLGMVCDFCATAMNKTIGKREEVSAVYVDLDTKQMSIVTKAGSDLDDETIDKLVKKAGYKVKAIHRSADEGEANASDAS